MNRPPDAAGLTTFTAALIQNATPFQVVASIMGSPEFSPYDPTTDPPASVNPQLTTDDVQNLLNRASAATSNQGAIVAIVDRGGNLLGVRVEGAVSPVILNNPAALAFAVDEPATTTRTSRLLP